MVKSYIPKTYEEALEILDKNEMILMAGGTDLMVKKRNWAGLSPMFDKDVRVISELNELKYIRKSGGFIHIGAMTTLEGMLKADGYNVLGKDLLSIGCTLNIVEKHRSDRKKKGFYIIRHF